MPLLRPPRLAPRQRRGHLLLLRLLLLLLQHLRLFQCRRASAPPPCGLHICPPLRCLGRAGDLLPLLLLLDLRGLQVGALDLLRLVLLLLV